MNEAVRQQELLVESAGNIQTDLATIMATLQSSGEIDARGYADVQDIDADTGTILRLSLQTIGQGKDYTHGFYCGREPLDPQGAIPNGSKGARDESVFVFQGVGDRRLLVLPPDHSYLTIVHGQNERATDGSKKEGWMTLFYDGEGKFVDGYEFAIRPDETTLWKARSRAFVGDETFASKHGIRELDPEHVAEVSGLLNEASLQITRPKEAVGVR